MRSAAESFSAALLDRAYPAWDQSDLDKVRELACLATGGAQCKEERLLWEALLSCVNASSGEATALEFGPSDLAGVDPIVRSEITYFASQAAFFKCDYKRATWWLASAPTPTPWLYARRLMLDAKLAFARDDFASAASAALTAVELAVAETPHDEGLIREALDVLVTLAPDVEIDVHRVQSLETAVGISEGTGIRTRILRTLAWLHALSGQSALAIRLFVRAEVGTQDPSARLAACVDRITLLSLLTDSSAREDADTIATYLYESAATVHWVPEDALLLSATVIALCGLGGIDAARKWHELLCALMRASSPRTLLSHGSRFKAAMAEASSFIAAFPAGERTYGYAAEAFALFSRLSFHWRASRMASVLYQAKRIKTWQVRGLQALDHYPPRTFPQLVSLSVLTPREREIFQLMRRGYKVLAVCDATGLGESTVRTHLRNIHHKASITNNSRDDAHFQA